MFHVRLKYAYMQANNSVVIGQEDKHCHKHSSQPDRGVCVWRREREREGAVAAYLLSGASGAEACIS